jgi:hypothetical protein
VGTKQKSNYLIFDPLDIAKLRLIDDDNGETENYIVYTGLITNSLLLIISL